MRFGNKSRAIAALGPENQITQDRDVVVPGDLFFTGDAKRPGVNYAEVAGQAEDTDIQKTADQEPEESGN